MSRIFPWWANIAVVVFLFVVIVLAITPRFIDYLDSRGAGKQEFPPAAELNTGDGSLDAGPPARVFLQEAADGPAVRYTDNGFMPEEIDLSQTDSGLGCFIPIVNESREALLLRLSPHEKAVKGNYGFMYDAIPPGNSLVIDPRYGRPQESFHNFNHPAHEFAVRFDASCVGR